VLEAMASHNRQPRKAILALGYAGWGAGQLEHEIRHNVWLTVEADEDLVFDDDYDTKWARALAKLRIDPKFLSAEGGRA
jgi:putative transcriptional regulator